MTVPATFRAFRIHSDGGHRAGIEAISLDDLSPGEVVIRAAYSSVNYKDALAGTGSGKILRSFPLVGGIDVAGHVLASTDPRYKEGDAVLCTGSGLSETRDGGYSEVVRLPAAWTIPLPAGLSLREAMVLGTAGFTAGLSLLRMEQNGQSPEQGPVVVTGATGGVGSLAIDILTRAGYEAHAISGKAEHAGFLRQLGAREIYPRDTLDSATRPLENARWAGAIDNGRRPGAGGPDPGHPALRQHRQLRPGRRPRPGHHGHALHHPGRFPARHCLRRHRPGPARAGLGAPGRPLEAGPPGRHLHPGSLAGRASPGFPRHAGRPVVRTNGRPDLTEVAP